MSRRSFELNGDKYVETDFINYFVKDCGKIAKIKEKSFKNIPIKN